MKCPTCPDSTLVMTDRQGVEIDYCPNCRGVWLDRGELDKIIDRAAGPSTSAPAAAPATYPARPDFVDSDYPKHGQGHRRKKSFLSDLFDF